MEVFKKIILSLLFITGCSDITPLVISDAQQVYIGIWHYAHKIETSTRIDIKNVVLSIELDSTAIYKTCNVVVEKKSIARSSSSNSMYLDSAIVTKLSDTEISLAQATEIVNLNFDLDITKKPFKENNYWYIEIDDVLLTKKDNVSITQLIEYDCPESEDIKLGAENT